MGLLKNKQSGESNKDVAAATPADAKRDANKELQKLRRMDLLELLLDQTRETERLSSRVDELEDLTDRLKGKLDDKDAQIEHLKSRLNDKDTRIAQLEERNRALAEANGSISIDELRVVEERALETYLAQRRAKTTSHGVVSSAPTTTSSPASTAAIQMKAKHGN